MGNPLSLFIANLFVSKFESSLKNLGIDCRIKCVEDIFAAISDT